MPHYVLWEPFKNSLFTVLDCIKFSWRVGWHTPCRTLIPIFVYNETTLFLVKKFLLSYLFLLLSMSFRLCLYPEREDFTVGTTKCPVTPCCTRSLSFFHRTDVLYRTYPRTSLDSPTRSFVGPGTWPSGINYPPESVQGTTETQTKERQFVSLSLEKSVLNLFDTLISKVSWTVWNPESSLEVSGERGKGRVWVTPARPECPLSVPIFGPVQEVCV